MVFTKQLREGVRRGRIRCSIRIWTRPHVKPGGRYRMDDGHIVVDSVTSISLAEITYDLARESGFEGVAELLKVARHGRGRNVYLIRFHYLPPGAWETPRSTREDVRRLALSFPGAEEVRGRFAFGVRSKGKMKQFCWIWMERIAPAKPRVPNPGVIAVRVPGLAEKARLLAAEPGTLFSEPHYSNFPAVLVRLDRISPARLESLLEQAWRCQAPPDRILSDSRPRRSNATT
jgi:hypothetical protein